MFPPSLPAPASLHRPDPRVLARARARVRDGGAVMFIVAMTLTLLGAMGVYALNMATAEVRASGYLRQSTQTHYVSEWAVLGAAEALTVDGQHLAIAISANTPMVPGLSNTLRSMCPSLAAVPVNPNISSPAARSCLMFWSADLMSQTYGSGALFNPLITAAPNTPIEPWVAPGNTASLRGDLGLQNLSPDFFVEFTDLTPTSPPAGAGTGPGQPPVCSYLVTVTGTGVTPTGGGPSSLGAGTVGGASKTPWAATEGFEQTRSRVIFGPAPCGY